MAEHEWLAQQFEGNRNHLRAMAYRMLGSVTEAEDAVQETWLRLSRSNAAEIGNLGGWLTTVVARVCLDMLRSRSSRREQSLDEPVPEPATRSEAGRDPEKEALLADSVGLALLVVLDRLSPAERLPFVLHDMFAVSFEEIATIVGRTPEAARQLASRARRRVQAAERPPRGGIHQQKEIVEAFLRALRARDFEGLVAVLDPDVVVRIDEAAARLGAPREIRGARNWAKGAMVFARFGEVMEAIEPMLVDGAVGLVWAPQGQLSRVLRFTIGGGRITGVEIIADPQRLVGLNRGVLQQ